jgi:hypothetical protein
MPASISKSRRAMLQLSRISSSSLSSEPTKIRDPYPDIGPEMSRYSAYRTLMSCRPAPNKKCAPPNKNPWRDYGVQS